MLRDAHNVLFVSLEGGADGAYLPIRSKCHVGLCSTTPFQFWLQAGSGNRELTLRDVCL